MKKRYTYVLSIGMSKEQYLTLRELARREGKSASKLMYDKLDLDNMPIDYPLEEEPTVEKPSSAVE